ncbi:endonuclease/exonuclease/phosphatase family protein [Adhaeribacter aquaticus]|uniref:endonuclease/exonuclease/phosphatase family protein n=1 Tax=Adhaeribacter aquaticus TaxID=299567 RepID=UPI00040CA31D|nr:endonuclease/exonuclease/phosphatase family protein [Adhaeribacter aquaticus]
MKLKKPFKPWSYRFILLLNIVAAFLLGISILASYISPALAWPVALVGIAYAYLLVINILFIIYWLILFKWEVLISFIVIMAGLPNLSNQVQLQLGEIPVLKSKDVFKVLTFNTRLFDLYRWTGRPETKDQIFIFLQDENADILCLQEFYTSTKRKGMNNLDSLQQLLHIPNVHVTYTKIKNGADYWGIATFSRFPIVNKGSILFREVTNNLCIYSDIKINEDTVRVYNVHFQSNRLKKEDYEFLDQPNKKEKKWLATRSILQRLKTGAIKRSHQVDIVAHHIKNSPYPVIICGDFNDPPSSYTYNKIRNNLNDAFVESGQGFGNTYNGLIPMLRIDYMLHDKKITSTRFDKQEVNLSDHFPLSCYMEIK